MKNVTSSKSSELWIRGGFPRSFLARSQRQSYQWREDYIKTFLERDIPTLGIKVGSTTLRRFWTMVAHYHGQIVNFSELGKSLGVSDNTIRHYIEILSSTFMIQLLQPWSVNTGKRLVKQPKLYFRDSGLLHTLPGFSSHLNIERHPKLGASWEGFILNDICTTLRQRNIEPYYWATHGGAELDLYYEVKNQKIGIEIKYADAPQKTPSMKSAIDSLGLSKLLVVYPGAEEYQLDRKIWVTPYQKILL